LAGQENIMSTSHAVVYAFPVSESPSSQTAFDSMGDVLSSVTDAR